MDVSAPKKYHVTSSVKLTDYFDQISDVRYKESGEVGRSSEIRQKKSEAVGESSAMVI